MVNVVLVSHDDRLYTLCSNLLMDLLDQTRQLCSQTDISCESYPTLYLWDGEPDIRLLKKTNERAAKHLFLLDGDSLAHFERGQMEQLFINLLDNSCKYTPKRGEIIIEGYPFFWERRAVSAPVRISKDRRLRSTWDPNSYRVDTLDSGPAIPEINLEAIFQGRASYSGEQDRSGGGLGLAICSMIAAQHKGWIWAETAQLGARFSVILPLYSPEPVLTEHISGCRPDMTEIR